MAKPHKILLTGIFKDESAHIRNYLDSLLPIIDCICVADTGSTDDSIEILENWSRDHPEIPLKCIKIPMNGFGPARTQALDAGLEFLTELGWTIDQYNLYAFTGDFDMTLELKSGFHLDPNIHYFDINQYLGDYNYYCIRFLNLQYKWICRYRVHEVWSCPDVTVPSKFTLNPNDVRINFKDSRPFKSKIDWYLQLGLQDYADNPDDPRVTFYLAQSYKDLGKFEQAVEYYLRRANMTGWDEETWYTYYQLVKCLVSLGQLSKAEHWAQVAYRYNPERAEPVAFICQAYRGLDKPQSTIEKWYHIWASISKPDLTKPHLFLEDNVYNQLIGREHLFHDPDPKILDYLYDHPECRSDRQLIQLLKSKITQIAGIESTLVDVRLPPLKIVRVTWVGSGSRFYLETVDGGYSTTRNCLYKFQGKSFKNLVINPDESFIGNRDHYMVTGIYRWWNLHCDQWAVSVPNDSLASTCSWIIHSPDYKISSLHPWIIGDRQISTPGWWSWLTPRSGLRVDKVAGGYWGLLEGCLEHDPDWWYYVVVQITSSGVPVQWTRPFVLPDNQRIDDMSLDLSGRQVNFYGTNGGGVLLWSTTRDQISLLLSPVS